MTDHDALLAAILANRADDTPRLVYADWRDENGQPERGEFIRVQCELAKQGEVVYPKSLTYAQREIAKLRCGLPDGVRYSLAEVARIFKITRGRARSLEVKAKAKLDFDALMRIGALRRRERELLESIGHEILGADWGQVVNASPRIIVPKDWHNIGYKFCRGFVTEIESPWEWWRTHHAAILARQPIERVKFTTMPPLDHCGGVQHKGWLEYSRERWPGIEFELPPKRSHLVFEEGSISPDEWAVSRRQRERIEQFRDLQERLNRGMVHSADRG